MADSESELERRMKLPPLARDELHVPEAGCLVCGGTAFWTKELRVSIGMEIFLPNPQLALICSRCHPRVS